MAFFKLPYLQNFDSFVCVANERNKYHKFCKNSHLRKLKAFSEQTAADKPNKLKSHVVYFLPTLLKGHFHPLAVQEMSLFYPWESKNTAVARSVCSSLRAQSFAFVKNNTHRCVQGRASQTYGCVCSTMLPLSLIPLRLTLQGQRSRKVFSPPLITILFACARIKSRPFHPHRPVFLILNHACRPLPFSLICFVSPGAGAAVFTQLLVNGGETRRHVHVCLWCINKRPGELAATTTTTTVAAAVTECECRGTRRRCGGWGGCTNQHPPPLSHANQAVGISRTLPLP